MKGSDKDLAIKILEMMGYDRSFADNTKVQYLIYQLKVKLDNAIEGIACKHLSTYEAKVYDDTDTSKVLYINTICKLCRAVTDTKPFKAKGTSPLN